MRRGRARRVCALRSGSGLWPRLRAATVCTYASKVREVEDEVARALPSPPSTIRRVQGARFTFRVSSTPLDTTRGGHVMITVL